MISISTNVAVGAGSIVMFAGFMLGYAIAWRQRRSVVVRDERSVYNLGGPLDLDQLTSIRENFEDRVRRSQT